MGNFSPVDRNEIQETKRKCCHIKLNQFAKTVIAHALTQTQAIGMTQVKTKFLQAKYNHSNLRYPLASIRLFGSGILTSQTLPCVINIVVLVLFRFHWHQCKWKHKRKHKKQEKFDPLVCACNTLVLVSLVKTRLEIK